MNKERPRILLDPNTPVRRGESPEDTIQIKEALNSIWELHNSGEAKSIEDDLNLNQMLELEDGVHNLLLDAPKWDPNGEIRILVLKKGDMLASIRVRTDRESGDIAYPKDVSALLYNKDEDLMRIVGFTLAGDASLSLNKPGVGEEKQNTIEPFITGFDNLSSQLKTE